MTDFWKSRPSAAKNGYATAVVSSDQSVIVSHNGCVGDWSDVRVFAPPSATVPMVLQRRPGVHHAYEAGTPRMEGGAHPPEVIIRPPGRVIADSQLYRRSPTHRGVTTYRYLGNAFWCPTCIPGGVQHSAATCSAVLH